MSLNDYLLSVSIGIFSGLAVYSLAAIANNSLILFGFPGLIYGLFIFVFCTILSQPKPKSLWWVPISILSALAGVWTTVGTFGNLLGFTLGGLAGSIIMVIGMRFLISKKFLKAHLFYLLIGAIIPLCTLFPFEFQFGWFGPSLPRDESALALLMVLWQTAMTLFIAREIRKVKYQGVVSKKFI